MKILIGYDASKYSEAALDDLLKAGLPQTGEFLVVSVAEGWLGHESGGNRFATDGNSEVKTLANHAAQRLRKMFPHWKISAEVTSGSPASAILEKANKYDPDLIVVGSHGRSTIGRFFLGSISNKILTEAHCSVRIARGQIEVDPIPSRVIIGYDGSMGADAAVNEVVERNWRGYTEIRLVIAFESVLPLSIGRFIPVADQSVEVEVVNKKEWLEKLAESGLRLLTEAGCCASLQIHPGNPKDVLVETAVNWHADSIFVGANRYGNYSERFSLGSVSAAVAARANCSVEVIRLKKGQKN